MKESVLTAFHAVSGVLEASVDLDEILYATLAAVTAGESFGFNRAFVLLHKENSSNPMLEGYFAMGPRTHEEADALWRQIVEKRITLSDIIKGFNPDKFEHEKRKFEDLLQKLAEIISKSEIIQKLKDSRHSFVLKPDECEHPELFELLNTKEIAFVPLYSRERFIGVIVADNFVTGNPIDENDLVALEAFASQASLAISRALLFRNLQEKIEELKELNRKLIESQKLIIELEKRAAIGELVNHIVHELKNPIVVIGGIAQALMDEIPKDSPLWVYAQSIVDAVSKLDSLLKETVRGIRTLRSEPPEPVDVNQLLRDKLNEMRGYLSASGIDVHVELEEGLPKVHLPRRAFASVLDYLIGNAVDAMPEGGRLTITTKFKEGRILISVEDSGVGIPKEHLDRIFEPFFTTKPKGSGLGLYNAKQIIRSIGGKIYIESAVGKGTKFFIEIPVLMEATG